MAVADLYDGFVGIGEHRVHQVTYITFIIAICPFVDFFKCEEGCFLAGLCIDGITLLYVGLYQLVSPPCQPHVLGLHAVVVRAAEVQVFEGEEFVLCRQGGGEGCYHQKSKQGLNLYHRQTSCSFCQILFLCLIWDSCHSCRNGPYGLF